METNRQHYFSLRQHSSMDIFLISALTLYLELLLIRWIGTEVNIFAYLQNSVLVICFLGLGVGCARSDKKVNLGIALLFLIVLVALQQIPITKDLLATTSVLLSTVGDLIVWNRAISEHAATTIVSVSIGLCVTFILMSLMFNIFVPLGQILGGLFDKHPRVLMAYSINLLGSLFGIWIFVALGVLELSPRWWFLVLAPMLLLVVLRAERLHKVHVLMVLALALIPWIPSAQEDFLEVLWSPYQKLSIAREENENSPFLGHIIRVNNTGYQGIIDLERTNAHAVLGQSEIKNNSQYDIPFLLHPEGKKVLIVGAGSGNDVAGALRHQVESITAVEIDPAIVKLGRKYHPEKPYDSSKVRVVVDDARAYFAGSQEKFDIISFGLLDSHTTTAMTNARLDHYVYTEESIRQAKTLLNEGGILALSFEVQKPFIADRIARVLLQAFGVEPLIIRIPASGYGWGGVMFIAGNLQGVRLQLNRQEGLAKLFSKWREEFPVTISYTSEVTSDDWPYLYLSERKIPLLYYALAVVTLLVYLLGTRQLGEGSQLASYPRERLHFFCLGAAFLLLEVQNVSKAAVALGNTWDVNAVIISGVLIMAILSNVLVWRFPGMRVTPVYFLLLGSCVLLYFVDLAWFGGLSYPVKAILVGALSTLPILFSGIVFVRAFSNTPSKSAALGANLFGSLIGAMLQSVSFIIGIKALLFLVGGFYLAAILTRQNEVMVNVSSSNR